MASHFTSPEYAVLHVFFVHVCRVSNHRNHHLHTDTPLDIHSPYEGFWWSHMGWLINSKVRSNLHGLASFKAFPVELDQSCQFGACHDPLLCRGPLRHNLT